jgi:hypothetical protein
MSETSRKSSTSTRRWLPWAYLPLTAWFAGGLFLDGWAHNHILAELESFFTPWHAVFYSGFAAVALLVLGVALVNRRGGSLAQGLPAGYRLSLAGIAVFSVGGAADMVWHTLFGIEANIEALLSPTHLILAVGGTLLAAAPLRSALAQPDAGRPTLSFPSLFSATITFSLFTFMTMFAQPIYHPWAAISTVNEHTLDFSISAQSLGVTTYLFAYALLAAMAVFLLRRFRLSFGSFTLLLGVNALLMSFLHDEFRQIPAAILAGLAADGIYRALGLANTRLPAGRRSAQGAGGAPPDLLRLRIVCAAVPALAALTHFATLALTDTIWWSVHLWAGVIVLAAVEGWLLSLLAFPSQGDER